jgi:hypothetical protein
MAGVTIYQRAQRDFGADLSARGHHVVDRTNENNRCPGCGRAQWYVGRMTAECGFCGTAVALAEAEWSGAELPSRKLSWQKSLSEDEAWAEKRRHERLKTEGRTLQLLIDGSPHSFAIHNISAGGLMGSDTIGLAPRSKVLVRFEGGILVPAEVRWIEGSLTGLAFTAPVLFDTARSD